MGGLDAPRLKGTLEAVTAALPDRAGNMKSLHETRRENGRAIIPH